MSASAQIRDPTGHDRPAIDFSTVAASDTMDASVGHQKSLMRSTSIRAATRKLLASLLLLAAAGAASAQPANDNFAAATPISSLPFNDTIATIAQATSEPGDPLLECKIGAVSAGTQSVWYRYTTSATPAYVNLDTRAADYDTILGVFSGSAGALRLVACNDDARAAPFGSALFGVRLEPSTTYYIVVARNSIQAGTATLQLSVSAAPQYVVDRLDDPTPDGCAANGCSLREAIDAANAAPGAVLLPAGAFVLTRAGGGEDLNATGDLDVRAGMGIYGAGTDVGTGSVITNTFATPDRALHVDPQRTGRMSVIVSGMRFNSAGGASFGSDGGAALLDGASTTFYGAFTVLDRVVINGASTSTVGGAIAARSRLLLRDSTLSSNSAGTGGGLYVVGDTLSLTAIEGSTLNGNLATSDTAGGGAIASQSPVWLANSTISGNSANGSGGGWLMLTPPTLLPLEQATAAIARGLDLDAPNAITALQDGGNARNVTVAGNRSDANANGVGDGGGLAINDNAKLQLRNSVIADNLDNNAGGTTPDCAAATLAQGNSDFNHVEGVGTCAFFVGLNDVTGTDPMLAVTLANNGGVTRTHLPLAGSPLIDAGDPAGCVDIGGLAFTTDQRDAPFLRVSGTACDKGAVEIQPQPAIPPSAPDLASASDSGASNTDNITNITQPTFLGSCSTGDTIEILINNVAVSPSVTCTAGVYTITLDSPLAEGNNIEVRARSTLGTSTALSGILPLTVDTTTPVSAIVSGPSGPVSATSATFVFTVSETAASECRLDAGTFQPCSSPVTYTGLQLGGHTFALRSTDAAGNVEVVPQTRTWIIRLGQTITFAAITDKLENDVPFGVTASSSSSLPVSFTSLTPTVCTVTTPSPGTVTLVTVGTCTIRASQPGDGTFAPAPDVDRSFAVRPLSPGAPDLAAISDSGALDTDNITNAASLQFDGACIDGDTIELLVNTVVNGASVTCASSAYQFTRALAEGTLAVSVRATRNGVASAPTATLTVVVDRTAPAAPAVTGPNASAGTTVNVFGTGENGARVLVSANASAFCLSGPVAAGAWSCSGTFGTNGLSVVNATQTDIAGNTSAVSADFTIDVGAGLFADGFE